MPELPEVETTRRGIAPWLTDARITGVTVREPRLRWRVADDLPDRLIGCRVADVGRRAKYLLLQLDGDEHLIIHLGMSGSLRLVPATTQPRPHDHVDIVFGTGSCLRFNDPRRFGSLHCVAGEPTAHPLLAHLGPEPLGEAFTGDWLYGASRHRRVSVKAFIMDATVVVGVGNIYAAEALYRAGIHPSRPARRISRERYHRLASAVKAILGEAIEVGGTTLRDFTSSDGRPGYFRQSLAVYGRANAACPHCGRNLHQRAIAQRTTVFCPSCQT